jgi:hypothetical protein
MNGADISHQMVGHHSWNLDDQDVVVTTEPVIMLGTVGSDEDRTSDKDPRHGGGSS